jgi:hypothetical protein
VRSVVADVTDDAAVQALFDGETRVDHVFLPAGELKPGGGDVLGSDLNALRSILRVASSVWSTWSGELDPK